MSPPPKRHVGEMVAGKYRLDAQLGEGGMGIVFRATDVSLNRSVAIKFVHARLGHKSEAVERLRREAQAVARLESDHVAKIYEVGEIDDGMPFLAMEHLLGSDLAHVLETAGPLPIPRAVDLLLQACEALAEAHVEGLIHRDLKPSNLFLCHRRDGSEMVKLLDFGIVKLIDDDADKATLTAALDVIGSIPYMAPEQLESSRHVTPRSDIWSLGAVLFTLVSGRLPFEGYTTHEIAFAIAVTEARPLSSVMPSLPQGFDQAVAGCFVRDPAGRYHNVAQLAAALAPFGTARAAQSCARIHHIWRDAIPSSATFEPNPVMARTADPPTAPHTHVLPHIDTHAPHLHVTQGTQLAAKRAPRRWVAFLIGGLALFAGTTAAVVGWRTQFSDDTVTGADEPTKAGNRPTKSKKRKKKDGAGPSKGRVAARLGHVDNNTVTQAVKDAGFTPEITSNMSGYRVFMVYDGDDPVGTVQLVDTDPVSAMITVDLFKDSDGTFAQDGNRLLCVEMDEDDGNERALFDSITTK